MLFYLSNPRLNVIGAQNHVCQVSPLRPDHLTVITTKIRRIVFRETSRQIMGMKPPIKPLKLTLTQYRIEGCNGRGLN